MARDDDETMTRSINVTPKTTEQHLIVRSDKCVAYVTYNKRLRLVLLKLSTDRHEVSRGLFTTELLVFTMQRVSSAVSRDSSAVQ